MDKTKILLAHGSGGRLTHDLISKYLVQSLSNPLLNKLDDAAIFKTGGNMAFTTDSYVVSPIFFPGGNIGKLAVCGTVNDLSVMGAVPKYLSLSFIIEEGLDITVLEKIIQSIAAAAKEAGVEIVTGDTKVVNIGKADKIFINTAGVGFIPEELDISGSNAQPGDAVIVSGTMGDHGIAIMAQREGLNFKIAVESDCAPLNGLIADMLKACPRIHVMRDPTRGGLATTLNEIAAQSQVGIELDEESIPVKPAVGGACDALGLDPLYVANEGKLIAILPEEFAPKVLSAMKAHPYGVDSAVIGRVTAKNPSRVSIRTPLGALRILDMQSGELLPRIC
ncbi:MAG: hydrogenase expression/formation protein HypE [Dehalococcoides mccartyi]|uniref:hydrogenase expression/formation protein HypE n=1 Tax=Dehalococcoides mccartyi TaxID=61435 RepID=UPI000805E316|nr:hydrogenase expression/formation protein HypE [Dehalococcoides mccartyi]OBW61414.1 MAG: hydrogenase expression/formation protein HypE [Dehalococcoides mccartyi]